MQSKDTTSPRPPPPKSSLARRLAAAEAAFRRHPTRRNLDRQTICFHRWYWASKAARTEAGR